MSDQEDPLAEFSGVVRLFPLPNLVLFPNVLQPLHVFEPRYRQMTRDALNDDQLIGMALLQAGWEKQYLHQPAIHAAICVCRIVADQALDDGRFNILVRGQRRARITAELTVDTLYRQARVELIDDVPMSNHGRARHLRKQMLQLLPDWFPDQPAVLSEFDKLFGSDISLGALCDILSFALPLTVEFKQTLLAEANVECRAVHLLERLAARSNRRFPPGFSTN